MLSKGQLCSYLAYIFSRSINSHDFISPPSHSPLVGLAMLSYLLPPLSMVNSNRLLTPTTALLSSTATPCTLEITAPGCLGASSVIASKTHRQIKTRRLQNWMTLKIKGRLAPPKNNIPPRISLPIDSFELEGAGISIDRVWVIGWIIIIIQLGISVIPWALHGRWSTFLITGAGTLLPLLTGSLRQ